MADAVRVLSQVTLGPLGALAAPSVNLAYTGSQVLAAAGSFMTLTQPVISGIPRVVTPPGFGFGYMAMFVDSANPQPVSWTFTTLSGGGPSSFTWTGKITAATPFVSGIGLSPSPGTITLTNLGTGTTNVRLYFWGP